MHPVDLSKRQQELDKLNALEAKIAREMKNLRGKMASMGEEMETFKNIDELKETIDQKKQVGWAESNMWVFSCFSMLEAFGTILLQRGAIFSNSRT